MLRLFGPSFVGLLVLALWVYCVLDVIATDEVFVRNLPKTLWLLVVIFLPTIGSVAWLALGRPQFAGWRPGDTSVRPVRPVVGPEDRQDFPAPPHRGADERLRRWEEDLRRREEELRRRQAGEGPGEGPASPPPGDG